jgi:mono/diheme cytochrome c family protein
MSIKSSKRAGLLLCVPGLMLLAGGAAAATPAEILRAYAAKAGSPPSAERGEKLFNSKNKGGTFESCADCHTAVPTQAGRDLLAEKSMPALAPAANAKRLTDAYRVETAFRLNCKDVMSRECTAQEKADVLSWLIGLKP